MKDLLSELLDYQWNPNNVNSISSTPCRVHTKLGELLTLRLLDQPKPRAVLELYRQLERAFILARIIDDCRTMGEPIPTPLRAAYHLTIHLVKNNAKELMFDDP